MESKLPKGLISSAKAKELNQDFVKTRGKALNKIVEKEEGHPHLKDAISSWFSIDELKKYIEYVESKSDKVNGLRVYFGAYAKNDKQSQKKGLSTVFFVPTEPKVGASQKDGVDDDDEGSSDIEDIEGLNDGTLGDPPSSEYPQ